jgi:hypothetical protein
MRVCLSATVRITVIYLASMILKFRSCRRLDIFFFIGGSAGSCPISAFMEF